MDFTGTYNKIICFYHGSAAAIVFDFLINCDEIKKENEFIEEFIEESLPFMQPEEIKNAISILINSGYIQYAESLDDSDILMLSMKSLSFM